ncbi:MAG TPA: glucuronate isomerase [Ilumatobacteraceae bacterium]
MVSFLGPDHLLGTDVARALFHDVAEPLPIVDVHNHLPPADIAGDRRWATITDLWLGDDHYKWKAMRAAGFDEALVSGAADPWDRFQAWAATVPRLIGNPLYVWTHLELQRAFGIETVLSPSTAKTVWDATNEQLVSLSARDLLARFGVALIATTDDPADPLSHHAAHRRSGSGPQMVPTFRPDAAFARLVEPVTWNEWADRLAAANGCSRVDDLDALLHALTLAQRRFAALGCRASDHGLACVPDRPRDRVAADRAIHAARDGRVPATEDREALQLEVLHLSARLAFVADAVLQLHLGPIRNASPRLADLVGRDVGADVMGDRPQASGLVRFLGDLERDGVLPRTVLYNANPADNAPFATLAGAFSRPGVASLVQWGPPWWFNDHEEGMRAHLDVLGQVGQLAGFIGMLTDSRSILSMTRHELFRRVLCAKLADEVSAGRFPDDRGWLATVVRRLCVENTCAFFGFELEASS